MKIKILMFFGVFALLISAISVKVGAFSIVENSTINEQSQTVWGYNMFDRQRFSSTSDINSYIYSDDNTYINRIALEGSYPLFTGFENFANGDSSILAQNTYLDLSYFVYDFVEGNYVSNNNLSSFNAYYYSYINDTRCCYWDYARFHPVDASLCDINGLWAFDRYFYWDTLLLSLTTRELEPYLMFYDLRLLQGLTVPSINIVYNFDMYDYDLKVFEHRSYSEEINLNSYIDYFEAEENISIPFINFPLFEILYEYGNLPTFISNLEIIIDANEYSDAYTLFSGFNFTLTNETDVDLWSDLIAYTPVSVITEDVDFVTWLVRGVSGVFDTELIPGISMGNILKLILSICLVIAVLRYFVGG